MKSTTIACRSAFFAGMALTALTAIGGEVILQTKDYVTMPAGKGKSYKVNIKPEWGVITLKTTMKTTDLMAGDEGWMDGRLPMSFHDKNGKMVGGWPHVFGFRGTQDAWIDCERDYPIPEGAATLSISRHNFGVTGTAEYGPMTLTVKRNRAFKPGNAPLPEGVAPDHWKLGDGNKTATRERWSLGGLWQMRPSFTNDAPNQVPGENDCWGWGPVPGSIGLYALQKKEIVVADWLYDKQIKFDFNDAAWYRREFSLPQSAAGRKVLLTFTMLNTRADVYVDGKFAATAVFPAGEADITPFVKPGEKQTLAICVTAYPLNPKTLDFNAPDRATETKTVVKHRGITGNLYLDVMPQKARITDGTVECDVAKGEMKFVAECAGINAGETYTLTARVGDKVFVGKNLRATANDCISFTANWADAPRWDTHTPGNLLTCALELSDDKGNVIDALLPFRFGFRDFKCVGKNLHLNGIPIHLRALYNYNSQDAGSLTKKETCVKMCRRLKSEGYNYIIAGNYHFSPGAVSYLDEFLDTCDEEGMLVSFSLPHIRDFNFSLDKPDVAARYSALTKLCVRMARNHPCVVTYAMNHNTTGYTGDMNPLRIDGKYDLKDLPNFKFRNRHQARIAWKIAHEIDGTRPIYHHESGNLDDFHTVNIYLNWSPVQERSDWLEHWSREGVKPLFFVEWGMPHVSSWSSYRGPQFIWRCNAFQSLWASEFAAAFRGDAAYEGDTPEVIRALKHEEKLWARGKPFPWSTLNQPLRALTNNYQGVQAIYMADNWRSHRAWGISAMLPWDQSCFHALGNNVRGEWDTGLNNDDDYILSSVGKVMTRWNLEDCAFIGGGEIFTDKRHHYRAGETVKKTLVILNDRRVGQDVKWSYCLKGENIKDEGSVKVAPGTRADVPVEFALPKKAGKWTIEATFEFAGGVVQKDEFTLETYAPVKTAWVNGLKLYDPVGLTTKEFDRLGIKYEKVDDTVSYTNLKFLVVGRGALTRKYFDEVVAPMQRSDRRVLVFEQDKETLESIGFRAQNYGLRNAFPRYSAKGLNLTEDMLRDWNGEATLIPTHLQNLEEVERSYARETWSGISNTRVWRCGNRGSVASVLPEKPSIGDWRAIADGAFDLQYAPLLDWVRAKGRITFCQFDVTARTVADPVADNLVNKLVARIGEDLPWQQWPHPVGMHAWTEGLAQQVSLRQSEKEIHSPERYIVSTGSVKPPEFDAEIAKGGKALLLGLTAEEVKAWSPVPLAVAETNGCYATRIEKLPPELNGLSNADWAWHGAMDFAAFTDKVEDGNAAFRVVRHGKGVMVFWQVPPWKIDEVAKPYLRTSKRRAQAMLARLLGNLGFISTPTMVRYRDVPVSEDDPYRYYRW